MIHSLHSTLPTFKRIDFRSGLNLIVVEKTTKATEGQTRNSAGKSSIIELLHFVLGGSMAKGHLVTDPLLESHAFTLECDVLGCRVAATRQPKDKDRIYLEGAFDTWFIQPRLDRETKRRFLTNADWKRVLGNAWFSLDAKSDDAKRKTRLPSLRGCLPYFARRREEGGFLAPERHFRGQKLGDYQVALSYLFGLDWRIPWDRQTLREDETALKGLRKIAKSGDVLSEFVEKAASIRPRLTRARASAASVRMQLETFEVHKSYKDLANEAARLRENMKELSATTVSDEERREHVERAIQDESAAATLSIEAVYKSAGVQLPELALKRFVDVEAFYESVRANRRAHLTNERDALGARLESTRSEIRDLDLRRAEIMRTLQGKGALDDFVALQSELAELESTTANLASRLRNAELLERKQTTTKLEKASLHERLQRDHASRRIAIDSAVSFVTGVIDHLYDDRTGGFFIDATEGGPEFKISVHGDRGGGIANMEIFALDLGLVHATASRGTGPGFLIHDSHLFDGVDSRQIATAIELATDVCQEYGWQYIVTMNSDTFAGLEFSEPEKIAAARLSVNMSDASESGGLFGIQLTAADAS